MYLGTDVSCMLCVFSILGSGLNVLIMKLSFSSHNQFFPVSSEIFFSFAKQFINSQTNIDTNDRGCIYDPRDGHSRRHYKKLCNSFWHDRTVPPQICNDSKLPLAAQLSFSLRVGHLSLKCVELDSFAWALGCFPTAKSTTQFFQLSIKFICFTPRIPSQWS